MRYKDRFTRLATAALFMAIGSSTALSQDKSKRVVVVTSGGAFEQQMAKNFYERFTKETGISVVPIAANIADQTTKVKLMAQSGEVEWDLISSQPFDLFGEMSSYLADLGQNCEVVAEAAQKTIDGACKRYGILRSAGGGVLAYDTTEFPEGKRPQTWADFWDIEKFPGARALPDVGVPWWVLMAALQADGVAADKLFPLDLDRAFKKLDEIKPHVAVWWKSGDQIQQLFRNKEVSLAMMFSGRAVSLVNEGIPLGYSWNGAPPDVAYWSVLDKAPNRDAAIDFVNFFYRDSASLQAFTKGIGYDTAGREVVELMDPEARKQSAISQENWGTLAKLDAEWVAQNRDEILRRWSEWLSQ